MKYDNILERFDDAGEEKIMRGLKRIMEMSDKIRPQFSHTWIEPEVPIRAELVKEYYIKNTVVKLYNLEEKTEDLYYIMPPEYQMGKDKIKMISNIKESLIQNFSGDQDVSDHEEIWNYVEKRGHDLLNKVVEEKKEERQKKEKNKSQRIEESDKLANVLAKYTAGYGVLETLLHDDRVEDIYVDAPAEDNNVYVEIKNPENIRRKCRTNVNLTSEYMDSIISRFRIKSGEPFSEAFPVLETDLPEYDTRATAIRSPLSDEGIALALRRRSRTMWTLPRLIEAGSLTPLAAGLLSFLIDGRSTFLVGGSRGAGKTTLLGAMMMEFPRSQRILTIEDTKELPTKKMQSIGYNVQSTLTGSDKYKGNMKPNEVLRVSLRLGESAIVMGEVRGKEAKTLYEAMRAGTAGSAVMGTIHGNSADGIYERVVHDIGISKESFSATDIVVLAGIVRPGGAQRYERKVIQIAEYDDGEFNDLMEFNEKLQSTDHLKRNSEKIGEVARDWGLSYSEAIENIKVRARIREKMVLEAIEKKKDELLGPKWVAKTNSKFWELISKYSSDRDYDKIEKRWTDWFEKRIKYA